MKFTPFFFLFCFTISCKNTQTTVGETTYRESGNLSLDLSTLKSENAFPQTQIFTSTDDPVYHKTKRFDAFSLKPFLRKYWNFEAMATSEMKIVFECEDGYKHEMPL
ncbi:MAG: hypothetical protein NWP83_04095 [Spirosomaceae bacterium]|nr:hypothetical protein [Spirosomataceae bacterium]